MRGVFTKHYGNNLVLDNFILEVESTDIVSLCAPSGRGKTTLLRLLCSLEENESDSGDFKNLRYSYTFQEDRLIEEFSALDNILLCCSESYSRDEVIKAMAFLGLDNTKQKVKEFSGGMKRRVAILRSLFAAYDILLLDEPFKGLDEALIERSASLIRTMSKGKCVILVTHNSEEEVLLGCKKSIKL